MSQEDIILNFPAGLAGFPELTRFHLLQPETANPLKFLQAVDRPEISFTCMDAWAVKSDYAVSLGDEDAKVLALEEESDALVLILVVVPEDPRKATGNLAGPLVVNICTRVGRQVMLDVMTHPLEHPVFTSMEEVVFTFPLGLVGFPECKQFRLIEPKDSYPLKFLHSEDQPDISFTCVDIGPLVPSYVVPLSEEDSAFLALEQPEDCLVLAMVAVPPKEPRKMTANLAGPLVLNIKTRQGRQVVLSTDQFPLRHRIIPEA